MTFLSQDGVGQYLFDGGSVLGLPAQTAADQLPQFLADSALEADLLALHLLQQLFLVRAFPRRLLVQHLVQDDSEGEDVRRVAVEAAFEGLDAHVEGGAEVEDLALAQFAGLDCEAEVSQFAAAALDEDVLALDVPVHHAGLPQSAQRQRDLSPEDPHGGFGHAVGGAREAAEEVAALAELADDEAEGGGVEDVQQFDGVDRVAGGLAAHFVVEQGFLLGGAEQLAVHYLHADQLEGFGVDSHVGLPAHAAADLLVDAELVAPETLHRALLGIGRAGAEWDGGFVGGRWVFGGGGGVGLVFGIFQHQLSGISIYNVRYSKMHAYRISTHDIELGE